MLPRPPVRDEPGAMLCLSDAYLAHVTRYVHSRSVRWERRIEVLWRVVDAVGRDALPWSDIGSERRRRLGEEGIERVKVRKELLG